MLRKLLSDQRVCYRLRGCRSGRRPGRGAALVDVGRRGRGAQRAEAESRRKGVAWQDMPVAGGGGEQAMTVLRAARHGGQPADRRADARLRHPRLGASWASSAISTTVAGKEGWDKVDPGGPAELLQV